MTKKKEIKKQTPAAKQKQGNSLVWLSWLIIIAVVFIAYGQTINFDYAMDDGMMIKNNTAVQEGFAGIPKLVSKSSLYYFENKNSGSYRPFTMASFAITTELFRNDPHPEHVINLILYTLCCLFLFASLRKMLPSWNTALHLAVTLLFILHPIHTEVVANIKSRDELMCFLGSFGALYYLFCYNNKANILYLVLSGVFYIFALGSKENSIPFLLIFPIALWFFTKADLKKIVLLSIPYIVLAGIFLVIRNGIVAGGDSESAVSIIDNSLRGATSVQDKYATICYIILKYIILLFYPNHLVYDYSYNTVPVINFGNWQALVSLAVIIGLGVLTIIGLKERKIYSFAILFFFINMVAVLNIFITIAATMAERFLFLPSVAFCLLIVSLLVNILKVDVKQFSFSAIGQKIVTGTLVAILVLYSAKTWSRSKDWRSNIYLFRAAVIDSPNSTRTHGSLGYELTEQAIAMQNPEEKRKLFNEAILHFKESLRIYDKSQRAWYNYGHALYEMGLLDSAFYAFKKSYDVIPTDLMTLNNLGAISLKKGLYQQAMDYFDQGLKVNPNSADLNANKGACYQYLGNAEKAEEYYRKAIAIEPNHPNANSNLNRLMNPGPNK